MKTVPLIYTGPLPEVEIPIAGQAKRHGKPVLVTEDVAKELLARGDFIEAKQQRNGKPTS